MLLVGNIPRVADWPYEEFMDQLHADMERAGVRHYAHVAERAGVNGANFSKYKSGQVKPTSDTVRAIAHALGAPEGLYLVLSGNLDEETLGETEYVPNIYRDLVDLDSRMGAVDPDEQKQLRWHVQLIIAGARERLSYLEPAKQAGKSSRRQGKSSKEHPMQSQQSKRRKAS